MPSSVINSDDGVISGTSGLKSTGGDDGVLVFQSKGTETARINTDKQIVAAAGTASLPIYSTTGDVNTGIFFPAADTIGFAEGGAEAMRIDSSGRMLVGSTTARTNLFNSTITSPLQVEGTGNDTSSTLVVRNSNDNGGPFYILAKTRGSTVGSTTVVQNDDGLGSIRFQGSDGTEFVDAAMIQVQVDGTPGANDMPGRIIFYTTADGASSVTERMRIDSSGALLVGTTSDPNIFSVVGGPATSTYHSNLTNTKSSDAFGLRIFYSNSSPNNAGNQFFDCIDSAGGATVRVRFYSNGGLANYSANNANLSDRREKTNFAPAKNYLDTICAIPVQTFNYIDQNLEEDDGLTLGVVAQDVQEVAPELVMESNWGTEEEPKMRLSIYQTDLQYALMKCIQELKAKNDALEARIAALETGE